MKEVVAGITGLALVGVSLFGGVDGGMSIAAGVVGLLLCLSVAR